MHQYQLMATVIWVHWSSDAPPDRYRRHDESPVAVRQIPTPRMLDCTE
jgi:hypothetical protein